VPGVARGADQIAVRDGAAAAARGWRVTYATKLRKESSRDRLVAPGREIDRQIRAFDPWPVAETLCTVGSCACGRQRPSTRQCRANPAK
jgi:methionyl-tRNA formyltransferase